MPRLEVDFGHVDEPCLNGLYPAECIGAELTTTRTDGSTMVTWTFASLVELPTASGKPLPVGHKFYYRTNLADKRRLPNGQPDLDAARKANYYLREFLKTIGAPWDESGFDTDKALHCKAVLKVEQEDFEGRKVERVKEVLPYQE